MLNELVFFPALMNMLILYVKKILSVVNKYPVAEFVLSSNILR